MDRKESVKASLVVATTAAAAIPASLTAQQTNQSQMSSPEKNSNRVGIDALITPDNSILILIDHQAFQFSNLRNMDPTMVMNNTVGLAKTAKVFGVPTILTTIIADRGGKLPHQIQAVFPDQVPIDRTNLNTWEDKRVVDSVKKYNRPKILMAGLFTEICLAFPAISALADGYDVYAVTDASGSVSVEAHERAIQRMVQAGVVPITWQVAMAEWQRDWAREKTALELGKILLEHGGSSGTAFEWELQLLNSAAGKK